MSILCYKNILHTNNMLYAIKYEDLLFPFHRTSQKVLAECLLKKEYIILKLPMGHSQKYLAN